MIHLGEVRKRKVSTSMFDEDVVNGDGEKEVLLLLAQLGSK